MNPTSWSSAYKRESTEYEVRLYRTTHNVGDAIMGIDANMSATNRRLQV
jgi:gluconate 2-dehydrogenase alpha chain